MKLRDHRYTKYESKYTFKKIPSDGRTRFSQICKKGFILIGTFLQDQSERDNLKRHELIKETFKNHGFQFYVLDQNNQENYGQLFLLVPHVLSASDTEFISIGQKIQESFQSDCLIINTKTSVSINIRNRTDIQCEITEDGRISLGEIINLFSGVQITERNIDRF